MNKIISTHGKRPVAAIGPSAPLPKQARIPQVTQVIELRPFKRFHEIMTDVSQGLDSVEADITQCLNAFFCINLPEYIDSQQPQAPYIPPQRRRRHAMFGPIMEALMPGLDEAPASEVDDDHVDTEPLQQPDSPDPQLFPEDTDEEDLDLEAPGMGNDIENPTVNSDEEDPGDIEEAIDNTDMVSDSSSEEPSLQLPAHISRRLDDILSNFHPRLHAYAIAGLEDTPPNDLQRYHQSESIERLGQYLNRCPGPLLQRLIPALCTLRPAHRHQFQKLYPVNKEKLFMLIDRHPAISEDPDYLNKFMIALMSISYRKLLQYLNTSNHLKDQLVHVFLDTEPSQKVPRTITLLFLSQRCYNAIAPIVHDQPALSDHFFDLNKPRQNRLLSFLNSLRNHTQIPLYFESLAATPPYIQHHFLQLRSQEQHAIIRGIQEGRSQKEALRFILSTRYCWKNWGLYQSATPRIKSLLSTYLSLSENMPPSDLLALPTQTIETFFTRLEEFSSLQQYECLSLLLQLPASKLLTHMGHLADYSHFSLTLLFNTLNQCNLRTKSRFFDLSPVLRQRLLSLIEQLPQRMTAILFKDILGLTKDDCIQFLTDETKSQSIVDLLEEVELRDQPALAKVLIPLKPSYINYLSTIDDPHDKAFFLETLSLLKSSPLQSLVISPLSVWERVKDAIPLLPERDSDLYMNVIGYIIQQRNTHLKRLIPSHLTQTVKPKLQQLSDTLERLIQDDWLTFRDQRHLRRLNRYINRFPKNVRPLTQSVIDQDSWRPFKNNIDSQVHPFNISRELSHFNLTVRSGQVVKFATPILDIPDPFFDQITHCTLLTSPITTHCTNSGCDFKLITNPEYTPQVCTVFDDKLSKTVVQDTHTLVHFPNTDLNDEICNWFSDKAGLSSPRRLSIILHRQTMASNADSDCKMDVEAESDTDSDDEDI